MGQSASNNRASNMVSKDEILNRVNNLFVNRQAPQASECSDTLHWVDPTIVKVSLPRTGGSFGGANVDHTLTSEFPELNQLREYLRNDGSGNNACGCDGDKKPLDGGAKKKPKKSHKSPHRRSHKMPSSSSSSSSISLSSTSTFDDDDSSSSSSSSSSSDNIGSERGFDETNIVPFYSSENSVNSLSDNYSHVQSQNGI